MLKRDAKNKLYNGNYVDKKIFQNTDQHIKVKLGCRPNLIVMPTSEYRLINLQMFHEDRKPRLEKFDTY